MIVALPPYRLHTTKGKRGYHNTNADCRQCLSMTAHSAPARGLTICLPRYLVILLPPPRNTAETEIPQQRMSIAANVGQQLPTPLRRGGILFSMPFSPPRTCNVLSSAAGKAVPNAPPSAYRGGTGRKQSNAGSGWEFTLSKLKAKKTARYGIKMVVCVGRGGGHGRTFSSVDFCVRVFFPYMPPERDTKYITSICSAHGNGLCTAVHCCRND